MSDAYTMPETIRMVCENCGSVKCIPYEHYYRGYCNDVIKCECGGRRMAKGEQP